MGRATMPAGAGEPARAAVADGLRVARDATAHESPPESFAECRAVLGDEGIRWAVQVPHPRLAVAGARDAARPGRPPGRERVARLHARFTGAHFPPQWHLDTTHDTPGDTVRRRVEAGVA